MQRCDEHNHARNRVRLGMAGGARVATVTFECFRAEKLVKVEEPTPCQYNLVVQARAACAPEVSHEET